MKKVLRISTSIMGESSVSSQLVDELLAQLEAKQPQEVTQRDFAEEPIPHFDSAWLGALSTKEVDRSPEQKAKVDFSDRLIAELVDADTLIMGLPMYNFSVPSMLKAWVDHIARAGVTFKYTASGAVGLLQGKQVILVAAMGGIHEVGATDFLRPYMKQIMAFIGLDDVHFITADGLNMGEQSREQGLANARSQIKELLGNLKEEKVA